MIKNKEPKHSFSVSLLFTIFFHLVVLLFVKKKTLDLTSINFDAPHPRGSIKIDRIELIKPEEVELLKKVGIKGGEKKDYFRPDMIKRPMPQPPISQGLSLGNLAPDLPAPKPNRKANNKVANSNKERMTKDLTDTIARPIDNDSGHFFYNPKKEKKIQRTEEQEQLKQEAFNNLPSSPRNPVAHKMSNFEIRYERPEGVSEDELNSDEKAYYAFFKRSYANYLTKLYATYEKISIERPGLERDFGSKHLLIGRIDYDEKGNIVLVKILKSSESDDIHYFFEETLKQLNLPNPPRSFIKAKKSFSTYYQIQIN